MPGLKLLPPRDRHLRWIPIAVSILLHAPLFLVWVGAWLPPLPPPLPERVIMIPLGTEGERAADVRFEQPSGGGARRPAPRSGVSALPRDDTGPPEPEVTDTATAVAVEEPTPPVPDPGPAEEPRPGRSRLSPALGEGTLWVRPLPLAPRDLARAVVRTHAELVDSAVTAIVQIYIDSVLNAEPAQAPLPRWVAGVGDQEIGVDSKWIYLGPIKIPTALVAAFLPLNFGSAEATDFTRFKALQRMREDVALAARRAQTMEDFKRAIRELRSQRERDREFAKNQRIPPSEPSTSDSTKPKPDIP